MERKYYPINEAAAKQAHNMMSFSDYVAGSKTAEYKAMVDTAYNLADKVAEKKPDRAGDAYYLADRYSKKLADNFNKDSEIGCRCPSVMIAGPANFPTKKKEKQVAAWDKNMQEYNALKKYLERIRNILTGSELILSNDAKAIDKLQDKLDDLKALQEKMKNVNAYYRKHKTLEGCDDLTPAQAQRLAASMASSWHYEDKPYATWALSNNNAEIHRVEARIKELQAVKAEGTTETETDLFRVVKNTEAMRLQIFFDGKPEPEVRDILKSNGFRWAPSIGCWQRQLTSNAEYSLSRVTAALTK